MGYWLETCCITGQPVVGAAYCVVLNLEDDFNIRMIMDDIHIAKGELNSYGVLEDITEQTSDANYSVDEYHKTDGETAVIFATQHAWESVIKHLMDDGKIDGASIEEYRKDYTRIHPKNTHQFHFEWFLIECFLYRIRRSFIRNNEFSGSQSENFEYLSFANSLIVDYREPDEDED